MGRLSRGFEEGLLLDTCTMVWLAAAPARLSKWARAALDRDTAKLYASDASAWELCLKWDAKKIELPGTPRRWFRDQSAAWYVERLPLDLEDFFRTSELPQLHRDPFDRVLVAQAIARGLTIVTPDPAIHAYPVAVLW